MAKSWHNFIKIPCFNILCCLERFINGSLQGFPWGGKKKIYIFKLPCFILISINFNLFFCFFWSQLRFERHSSVHTSFFINSRDSLKAELCGLILPASFLKTDCNVQLLKVPTDVPEGEVDRPTLGSRPWSSRRSFILTIISRGDAVLRSRMRSAWPSVRSRSGSKTGGWSSRRSSGPSRRSTSRRGRRETTVRTL